MDAQVNARTYLLADLVNTCPQHVQNDRSYK